MLVLPILPVFFWLSSALLLARKGLEWRAAFLVAAVLWGCLIAAFTELLSCFHLLTTSGIALGWGVATVVVLFLHFRINKPWPTPGIYSFSALEKGILVGVVVICLATFVTAILAPPNTWDSMTYHMSRIMHWLQNRSVDHYPTNITRQIDMNPWAEFAIAHFQALSGGDRYANLVQWFSMVGSLIGVSLITQQLGGDRLAQFFAAVVVATIPMGILQATSTQNDYVVAFWLVCFVWSGLHFIQVKEPKWAVLVGTSLGLAVLSKGTAYLYAFPFVIWIAFSAMRGPLRQGIFAGICIVTLFMLLNGPHYQRNMEVFSHPLTSGQHGFANEKMGFGPFVSNVARSTAMQLATPFESLNQYVADSVRGLHKILNLDPNDPRTTWTGSVFEIHMSLDEDSTNNLLHVSLIASVLITLVVTMFFLKPERFTVLYAIAVIGAYLLFCLILKWQPWQSRLLLPLFVLVAPMAAVIAKKSWKSECISIATLVLLTASLPWLLCNSNRPLIVRASQIEMGMFPLFKYPRNQLYFATNREAYEKYVQIANEIQIQNATKIGLVFAEFTWEYPLWVLIKERTQNSIRIEHIEVRNASRLIRKSEFQPDHFVTIDRDFEMTVTAEPSFKDDAARNID